MWADVQIEYVPVAPTFIPIASEKDARAALSPCHHVEKDSERAQVCVCVCGSMKQKDAQRMWVGGGQ